MVNYELFKKLLVLVITITGLLLAIPNIFSEEPVVQISIARSNDKLEDKLQKQVTNILNEANFSFRQKYKNNRLLIYFHDTEEQIRGADIIKAYLGSQYTVVPNLVSSIPDWLQNIGFHAMRLGLDLRGGVHFLLQVDMNTALKKLEDSYEEDIKIRLRKDQIHYINKQLISDYISEHSYGAMQIAFDNKNEKDKAYDLISKNFGQLEIKEYGDLELIVLLGKRLVDEKKKAFLQHNITILRNRVNEIGVSEPIIQREGEDRIIVQLPGIQDINRAKEILGATATLEFRMVEEDIKNNFSKTYKDQHGNSIILKNSSIVTGNSIVDATSGIDQHSNKPAVFISLDDLGAKKIEEITKNNIGKYMAVLFSETKTEKIILNGISQRNVSHIEEIISIAIIRDQLGKDFQITGLRSLREAHDLALLLRAGSLATPVEILEERTVGPTAGRVNILQGVRVSIISIIVVAIFMVARYKKFGLISVFALIINIILLISVLSMLQATLTLPGIAGIILTIGMAVDSNVLIYERIREELKIGVNPNKAIVIGFNRAFNTILDANITTLIAALALFTLGTGPIKGFAVTLSIGIGTSMFTSITLSRMLVDILINVLYSNKKMLKISI